MDHHACGGPTTALPAPSEPIPAYPRFTPDLTALAAVTLTQRCAVTTSPQEGFLLVVGYPKDNRELYPGPLFDAGCRLVRSIQEDPMLSTAVSGRPTFKAVWAANPSFREALLSQKDPTDFGKWALRKPFNYVIPSLFIPCVATSFYQQFATMITGQQIGDHGDGAGRRRRLRVLDPCAGWGDRLTGAFCSGVVGEYVGVDPNSQLFAGYGEIKRLFAPLSSATMKATMVMQGFETVAPLLADASFDVVFTSPPFFDYEVYSQQNPTYVDWEAEFYEPLVSHALRLVHASGVVAFHIDDTTAGKVPHAIRSRTIAKFAVDVGFSKRKISVWVLRAGHEKFGSMGDIEVTKRPREEC